MNRLWLVFRKDAQRFWGPLLLWLVLITARYFVEWLAGHPIDEDAAWIARMRTAAVLVWMLEMLVGYLLAGAIALEDPVTDSTAFWMTRPMSGVRLLAGKLLGCVTLLLLVPLLVAVPWWMAADLSRGEFLRRGEELARWHASMAGGALVVATFTGDLGRFLAASLAVSLGGVVLDTIAGQARMAFWPEAKLMLPVVLVGFAAAVFARYQSRGRAFAFALLAVSSIGAVLVRAHGG